MTTTNKFSICKLRPGSHYAGGIKNWGFTLRTHPMFSGYMYTTSWEFKNKTITSHFRFALEENSVREIANLVPRVPLSSSLVLSRRRKRGWEIAWSWLWRHRYRRASFSKCFLSTRKRKAGVFKFLCFEERYRKALFSWRISGDGHRRK